MTGRKEVKEVNGIYCVEKGEDDYPKSWISACYSRKWAK